MIFKDVPLIDPGGFIKLARMLLDKVKRSRKKNYEILHALLMCERINIRTEDDGEKRMCSLQLPVATRTCAPKYVVPRAVPPCLASQ